jgi:tripartite-type tricarboxylate transporter receptor subunit TctC
LPELVTVAEAGIKGYATTTWYGVLAPAGTRPAVIARLNSELKKAVEAPEVHQRLSGDGAEPVGGTPDHFQKHLAAEMAKWRKVIRDASIRAE